MAKKPEKNLLDLVPNRRVDWEINSDERIDLVVPKFKNAILSRWMKRLGKSTVVKIHLDDFGSYVWRCCDSSHTIHEIGNKLRDHFGESVEPVFERLAGFIRLLIHHRYITLSSGLK